ncbi:MAG: RNA 2',3'-cyclic phosphodiesterase [Patescibacteria group bacterium]|nr:RNA 2',3'-cyclic phosphodiesterase [Patescibacteria group bacterium]
MRVRKLHAPRRVFIGIKLSEELSDAFVHLQAALGNLPGWFIPPEDIHLTLVPPFETRDLPFTKATLHTALQEVHRFKLRFLRLDWGPDKERPRLAWVECGATKELVSLKKKLLHVFGQKEKVPFVPHMTIARFRKTGAEEMARYPIARPVRFSMEVESIELFESPHKGGSGYRSLASIRLQPKDGVPI